MRPYSKLDKGSIIAKSILPVNVTTAFAIVGVGLLVTTPAVAPPPPAETHHVALTAVSSGGPNALEIQLIRQALRDATTAIQQATQLATNAIETQTAVGEKELEIANDALSKANDLIQLVGRGFAHRSIAGLVGQALQDATSVIQQGTQLAGIGADLSDGATATGRNTATPIGGPTSLPASFVRAQARTSKSQPSQRAEPTRARQHHRPNR